MWFRSPYITLLVVILRHQNSAFAEKKMSPKLLHAQRRIQEKVDRFMSSPVDALRLFHAYYQNEGFPNNLQGPDRSKALKYLYSIVTSSSTATKPFYGLEDGTFVGFFHKSSAFSLLPEANYREPGNSGYVPGSDEIAQKFFNVCTDSINGTTVNCLLKDSMPLYIECNNDCALVPCPNENTNKTENSTKWCRDYKISTYEEGQGRLGYVPTSSHCIDENGVFTQEPGKALIEGQEKIIKGTCAFQDGTIVDRVVKGEFAYCSNEPGGVCSTTFAGAYKYYNYDHRWRPWYIDSRKHQKPQFSDPYPFYSQNSIGITFTHPIFLIDESLGKEVLHGFLAADLVLQDITEFLQSITKEDDIEIAIHESDMPHSMIGISTGSRIVKYTVKGGNNQVCTEEQKEDSSICEVQQLTIDNFAKTEEDHIFAKVHSEFAKNPDLKETIIEADENDVFSTSYLCSHVNYTRPEENLFWSIVVTKPLKDDPQSTIIVGDVEFIVLCVIATIGFSLCFGLFLAFCRKRHERIVQNCDYKFTST